MTRALIGFVILCAVMAVMTSSHEKPLLVSDFHHAQMVEGPPVIPWRLTTQCTVGSPNLPIVQPERTA